MSKLQDPPHPEGQGLSDWELWACAKQQVDQHGDIATEMAAIRADELLAAGDLGGNRTWIAILSRIRHLLSVVPGETQH